MLPFSQKRVQQREDELVGGRGSAGLCLYPSLLCSVLSWHLDKGREEMCGI